MQNYAYSKAVNWAVLTNFRYFRAWYITRDKVWPFCNADIIEDRIDGVVDKLWWFQNDNLLGGAIEEEAKGRGIKLKKIDIAEDFSANLNIIRSKVNNYFEDNYKNYSNEEVEELTQGLINRLIFIKKLEAENIEPNDLEQIYRNTSVDTYNRIIKLFERYRKKYDTDIFGRPNVITELEKIKIWDDVIRNLLDMISKPKSGAEYNFSAIDVDVLGTIYENYLAYIQRGIELSGGKGERKKHGIYYTPKYIVDYIVESTLGDLLKTSTLDVIKKLKILDLSCGSGSFLIGVISALDRYYDKNMPGYANFSARKKLDIIKNNVYGVDLDERAVQIAKLSTYLKLLTLSSKEEISEIHETLLPELTNNIKNGNSIIEDKEIAGGNGFEWRKKFKEIMDDGGFDIIVGNPPYVRIQTLDSKDVNYFNKNYASAKKNYDIYVLFVERGLQLLKDGGRLGFILPSKFFNADYGEGLRNVIADTESLYKIIDFKDFQVFGEATNYTCLLFLKKAYGRSFDYYALQNRKIKMQTLDIKDFVHSKQEQPKGIEPWNFVSEENKELMNKLKSVKLKLGDIAENIFQGLTTSADSVYLLEMAAEEKEIFRVFSKALGKRYELEKTLLKPILKGQEIKKWSIDKFKHVALFPYQILDGKPTLIDLTTIKSKYPRTFEYIEDSKQILESREGGKIKGSKEWYGYIYRKNLEKYEQPKILTQVLASKNSFAFDSHGKYYFVGGGNAGGYGITLKEKYKDEYETIIALLNSKLLDFYLRHISTPFRGGFYSYGKRFIEKLPIVIPNSEMKEKLSTLAKKQASLSEKFHEYEDRETNMKNKIKNELEENDKELDEIVYRLYGITEEEKKIIEGLKK